MVDLVHSRFEVREGIGWFSFDRPKELNALNPKVFEDIATAVEHCEADPDVRALVLTGNRRAFAAGADIKHMASGDIHLAAELTRKSNSAQQVLSELSKPSIAAIAGYALGCGCELALCCDFRIAAENAVFGLPEIKLGIIPGGGGTQRLPRLIGLGAAVNMILSGDTINAQQALQTGLVHDVVPMDRLEEEAEKLAVRLSRRPVTALNAAKTATYAGTNMSLPDGLKLEWSLLCMLFGTEDQSEGMTAFIEKRQPNFTGR
ncbi:MAG: enoyl-CoA hydratase/isomerase family protein [Desulfohalobiaceae bacterium]|nr:enoyl-CoA hydratase/isomerase family protein [Desulfohalobiaceae bacterium]